jgi:hypothetical protein
MLTKLLPIAVLLGSAALASGQAMPRPDVPEQITAPANEEVVLMAHATGAQIYVCKAASDGKPAWSLKAPEAELHDAQGAVIGRHSAGPTWKDKDGSEITGKVIARVNAPESASIQWLLVSVIDHSGKKKGVFTHVTSVQRINTQGGMPPSDSDCNTSKLNTEVRSPYTADYYFYAPAK